MSSDLLDFNRVTTTTRSKLCLRDRLGFLQLSRPIRSTRCLRGRLMFHQGHERPAPSIVFGPLVISSRVTNDPPQALFSDCLGFPQRSQTTRSKRCLRTAPFLQGNEWHCLRTASALVESRTTRQKVVFGLLGLCFRVPTSRSNVCLRTAWYRLYF
jgi:hypothetical protein